MSKKNKQNYPVQIVSGLILGLFIISFSVVFTLNFRPLYYADINLLHISEYSGYSESEIRENYDALIDYNSLFNHDALDFPTMAMSESGKIHFEEVKVIFDFFGYMGIITAVLSVILIILLRNSSFKLYLLIAGFADLILPIVLGFILVTNWDYLFVTFHEVVFNNDYWIFDSSTDPVIDILPDEFFMHCAIMIFLLIIVFSIICIVTALKIKRKNITNIH